MKIVLATGIYPPDIGGPATYVKQLAEELRQGGNEVVVVTYDKKNERSEDRKIERVSIGLPVLRWFKYAKALKKVGSDADIVYAFSSISCGIPVKIARLKKPRKILRLGGDFFWERYTALGGGLGLGGWYGKRSKVFGCRLSVVGWILKNFDHVVFSTEFQQKLYQENFKKLPSHSVIENAVPEGHTEIHVKREPFSLLFMGRLVGFKNLKSLVEAVKQMANVRLTLVGDGPKKKELMKLAGSAGTRIMFVSPVHGEEKIKVFAGHDLMVIPSITEISPNVALEARANGLPVLLTEETGLSPALSEAMVLRNLSTPEDIINAIKEMQENYSDIADVTGNLTLKRGWKEVAEEHMNLFNES
ncbi:MAG: glycosyltransferase family 4 protein [Candidatus Peribacteraceae bacterium]|jgi:glycosyltransferase involved in cell wall biosynthesis|nr:glycosyltransferase family 4 protein [Candidatus Peribacteraceae bacterium]MDP7454700.1 glycosyltransferase family 4 protein [Candidatus Peribacteraceae bacterium]MDP7646365.1 glycosyltransferase family 4 protein [Candidatus Peribacteraceae bacterium]